MGKESLPLVYGQKEDDVIKVEEWFEPMLKNKDAYKDCYVTTFTRVKNLGSSYMHEYTQFIVEDRNTGDRTRIYAERANEDIVDMITLGRNEQHPRKWPEMPLPLTSLIWEDKATQPSLLQIAALLYATNQRGGAYKLMDKNCFWFAYTSFESIRIRYKGTLKNWLWINPGGAGGGRLRDAWGLGFPTMFKFAFKSKARDFEKERKDHMIFLQPEEDREEITPEDFVKEIGSALQEPQAVSAYEEWAKMLGVEINKEILEQITSNVAKNVAALDDKKAINWTQDFDDAAYDLRFKINEDPKAEEYLKIYEDADKSGYTDLDLQTPSSDKAIDAVTGEERPNPQEESFVPNSDADEQLARALRMLVGAVVATNPLLPGGGL